MTIKQTFLLIFKPCRHKDTIFTMAAQQHCLLDQIMLDPKKWTVWDMIQIENHISAGTCPNIHPPVRDLAKAKGGLRICLLRACDEAQGYLGSVKKIIEVWGADVNSTSTHFLDPRRIADISDRNVTTKTRASTS